MLDTLSYMVWSILTLAISLSIYLTVRIYSTQGFRT